MGKPQILLVTISIERFHKLLMNVRTNLPPQGLRIGDQFL
jgi:hypothetical protein